MLACDSTIVHHPQPVQGPNHQDFHWYQHHFTREDSDVHHEKLIVRSSSLKSYNIETWGGRKYISHNWRAGFKFLGILVCPRLLCHLGSRLEESSSHLELGDGREGALFALTS